MSLLCVIPFCAKDAGQARNLLKWIAELGGCRAHPCLLVADAAVPWDDGKAVFDLAVEAFKVVACISNPEPVNDWIQGSNSLFRSAATWARGQPFFWLEPDAVPLRAGWLDDLEQHWKNAGKPFMGSLVHHNTPGLPNPYLEGCAVYPADCWVRLAPLWNPLFSWTRATALATVPHAVNTPLMVHIWGEAGNPPTFAPEAKPGTNVFCLAQLEPGAALFHRNKDGTLIQLLREKMGLIKKPEPVEITTVLAFCDRDAKLMLKSLLWMKDLCGQLPRRAIVHFDGKVPGPTLRSIIDVAHAAFAVVETSKYPTPTYPHVGWPLACNWAFRHACKYVESHGIGPWLWFEADCVAVVPDWLYRIETEYVKGGQPFMGAVIGGMGHINGTAVYPPNPVHYAPAIMTCNEAWDTAIRPQIEPFTHRGNDVIQHCRHFEKHECHECHGSPPVFRTLEDLAAVHPTTGMFHPCKDGTLIDRLREKDKS